MTTDEHSVDANVVADDDEGVELLVVQRKDNSHSLSPTKLQKKDELRNDDDPQPRPQTVPVKILESPKLTPLIIVCLGLVCLILLFFEGGSRGRQTASSSIGKSTNMTDLPLPEKSSSDPGRKENACELPPCELVLQSRLYSERCGTSPAKWPLLITGTPRSATVYTTNLLQSHGMDIQNDWGNPHQHGSVSWIFAFEDENNFGPARTGSGRPTYQHVLHQVKDPLGSIASMCTNPYLGRLRMAKVNFCKDMCTCQAFMKNHGRWRGLRLSSGWNGTIISRR